jgi:hypothetical protein
MKGRRKKKERRRGKSGEATPRLGQLVEYQNIGKCPMIEVVPWNEREKITKKDPT